MRGKGITTRLLFPVLRITPAYAGKSFLRSSSQSRSGGSPPRMRGKGVGVVNAALRVRITPAYAGKRPRLPASCLKPSDHPRVCGEKSAGQAWVRPARGSPPRMRGKGGRYPINMSQVGITPAYAGKRPPTCRCPASPEDHPRVCGEKKYG